MAVKKLDMPWWSDEEIELAYWGIIDKKGNFTNLKRSDGELISDFPEDLHGLNNYTKFHDGILVTDVLDSPVNFAFDSNGVEIEAGYGAHPFNEGILPINYGEASFIDLKTGETLFKDKDFYDLRPFNQGLAPVALRAESADPVWRFMNRNGEILMDIVFADFQVRDIRGEYKIFNENSLATIQNTNGRWGVIDKTGKTIIPFKYDALKIFTEDLAGFKKNGKYGFMDINEKVHIEPIFDDVSAFNNGIAAVRIGDKAHLIDKSGKKVKGSDTLSESNYFKKHHNLDGSVSYTVFAPGEYVIIEKNSKYGLGKIDITDIKE